MPPVQVDDVFCCGQPAFNAGFPKLAARAVAHAARALETADCVVVPSGSCTSMLRHHALELTEHLSAEDASRVRRLASRVVEWAEWAVDHGVSPDADSSSQCEEPKRRIALHSSCHTERELGATAQSREVLRRWAEARGHEIVDLPQGDRCCGFGGVFSVDHGPVSQAMACHKLDCLAESGADVLVTGDPGCLLQLESARDSSGRPWPVVHLAELLNYEGPIPAAPRAEAQGSNAASSGTSAQPPLPSPVSAAASFRERSEAAMADSALAANVMRAAQHSLRARAQAIGELDEGWGAHRSKAKAIRADAVDNLRDLCESAMASMRGLGHQVYFASDAAQARRVVTGIVRETGARRVIKSKSMTSEELQLSPHLEQLGLEVFESDLGEYIIQLAKQPPSHITAPALHLSRGQIGSVFERYLGIGWTDDPDSLTAAARRRLREAFVTSDLGVVGGNFIAADTGAIFIVENEGNVRLGLSLPPVVIAIVGMEKVVRSESDVPHLLRMLGRSATGQSLTGYTHRVAGLDESAGPRQFHVIFVDNGRSRMAADPALRESLSCIRCGACMNVCPVYQHVGGHAYGSTYMGPIGSVITPGLSAGAEGAELPYASSLCGACKAICPVDIDLPRMLLHLRARAVDRGRVDDRKRAVFRLWGSAILQPRSTARLAKWMARWADSYYGRVFQRRLGWERPGRNALRTREEIFHDPNA